MTYAPERLRKLLVPESSRAQRLRQSSPFLAEDAMVTVVRVWRSERLMDATLVEDA